MGKWLPQNLYVYDVYGIHLLKGIVANPNPYVEIHKPRGSSRHRLRRGNRLLHSSWPENPLGSQTWGKSW